MKQPLQIKQNVKVKLSVRARLMYAGGGIAIAAVIAGFTFFLYSNLGTSEKARASANGDYRSVGSGTWSNAATWEKYNGSTWAAAVSAPVSADGVITIQTGNIVTVSSAVTVDQVVINSGGELDLSNATTLTVANGTGADLDVSGIFKNAGTVTKNTGAVLKFQNGGKYQHAQDGGSVTTSNWTTGSTCEITGVTTALPANLNQSFYNFTWNCPGQTVAFDFAGVVSTVNGDLTIISTGSSLIQLDMQGNNLTLNIAGNMIVQGGTTYGCTNGSDQINVAGNYTQTAGNFYFNKSGGTAYGNNSTIMYVTGNMTISGGTIDLSQCDANNASKGVGKLYLAGNLAISGTGLMTEASVLAHGEVYFNGNTVQYFTSNNVNSVTQKVNFTVLSGAILRMDDYILTGNGTFTLQSGAGLMMGNANGITSSGASGNVQVTGTRSYSSGSDYTYNGVVAQYSGNGLPSTVHNLTLDNSSGLTLTNTVAVSNLLYLTNGILTTGNLEVNVINNSTSAIASYSISGYINGNLRRTIQTAGTFYYPVGTASQYELASLAMHSLSGVSNILVNFNNPHTGTTPNPGICIVNGSRITDLLNYGYWNITPNVALTSGNYDLTLKECGYTNGGTNPGAYAIVRRANTSSDWVSSGIHNNNTQSEVNGTVTAVRTVVPVTGNFAIGFSEYSLPINLVYFKASPENNSSVKLTWETATEHNNHFFIVQRSADGAVWVNIDTVAAAGNSVAPVDYKTYDNHPIEGESYYRLKQCDYGVNYLYSDAVRVKVGEGNSMLSGDFNVYPNPTRGLINISIHEITDETMIRVFDIKGALIEEIKPAKEADAQIDLRGKSPGTYIVKVGNGGVRDVSKQIVLSE